MPCGDETRAKRDVDARDKRGHDAVMIQYDRKPPTTGVRAETPYALNSAKYQRGLEGLRCVADTPLDPFIESVGSPTDNAHWCG
jgi:hypothetical protein